MLVVIQKRMMFKIYTCDKKQQWNKKKSYTIILLV
jgi:hypothetical protein